MLVDDVKAILRQHEDVLKSYNVSEIYVFGSIARGTANEASDIDLIVVLSKPITLFKFINLRDRLSVLLGRAVDLVTDDALHPALAKNIWKEAIRAA